VTLLSTQLGRLLLPHRAHNGQIAILIYNLMFGAVLCLLIGIWWRWRKSQVAASIFEGFLAGLLIALVNAGVAFAGCGILSSSGLLR
jgi:hypothetical protein